MVARTVQEMSDVVAAARLRHSKKGPPYNPEDAEPAHGHLAPPPPEAPEGAAQAAGARAARRRDLKAEATSVQHLLTHTPTNPYCQACMYGKALRVQHRKGAMARNGTKPSKEGDLMTMDVIILKSDVSRGGGGETALFLVCDVATSFITAFASAVSYTHLTLPTSELV